MFYFLNCIHCVLLDTIYSRKNKLKSNKCIIVSSSSSLGDRAMNLSDDYEETPNVKVTNQGLTIKKNRAGIPYSIVYIAHKVITEWRVTYLCK